MLQTITTAAIVLLLFAALIPGTYLGVKASEASAGANTDERARETAEKAVIGIQRADYEGDRAALKRYVEALSPFVDDTEISSRIRYWRGFALWRRSLNGFNDSVDPKELETDLMAAVGEFDAAASQDSRFV